ncbi:hypothetical protein COJ48_13735 [Bacillus cereus]|nr:hypothetical protein COJ48_13735 [Bacillus cereus]PGP79238.1 hypothetical protein CN997_18590 [Bacillus cereus]
MFIHFKGITLEKNGVIYFVNASDKSAFTIEGKGVDTFKKILPYLEGKIDIVSICNKFGITKKEFITMIDLLTENNILTVYTNDDIPSFTIVSDNFEEKSKELFSNKEFSDKIQVININKIDTIQKTDFLISFDLDTNEILFEQVNKIANNLGIPWVRAAISNNNIYLGPIFFEDGGPCYHCYSSRKEFNSLENNIINIFQLNSVLPLAIEYIRKLLIQIGKPSENYTLLSTREINIDLKDYTIKKTRILKMPFCKTCSNININEGMTI